MKNKKSGIIRKILLFVLFIFLMPNRVLAEECKEYGEVYSENVPKAAYDYAEKIAPELLGNVHLYEVRFESYDDIQIGNPYTVYATDSIGGDEIYYFPIVEKESIKMILSIYKDAEGWSASLSKGMADELDALLKKEKDILVYYENGSIYGANEDGRIEIETGEKTENYCKERVNFKKIIKKNKNKTQDLLERKSEICDITEIREDMLNTEIDTANDKASVVTPSISVSRYSTPTGYYASNPLMINTSTAKVLNTLGCTVNQQDSSGKERGMCWAACVATIVRYRKGNRTLTAQKVCNMMGKGMDEGANPYYANNALFKYGLNYTYTDSQLSYNMIQNNIKNKWPIYMSCKNIVNGEIKGGHAVTLTGYGKNVSTGAKSISFWNSGSKEFQNVVYKSSGTKFSYAGKTWTWKYSLY